MAEGGHAWRPTAEGGQAWQPTAEAAGADGPARPSGAESDGAGGYAWPPATAAAQLPPSGSRYPDWAAGFPPPPGFRPAQSGLGDHGGWGSGGTAGVVASAPPPSGRRRVLGAGLAVLLVAGATGGGVAIGHQIWGPKPAASSFLLPGTTSPDLGGSSSGGSAGGTGGGTTVDAGSVAAKVDPAVVDINVTFRYQGARGAGTGIVLTSGGIVLTNNHVINGATTISVTDVGNGNSYNAAVVGYDNSHDIAVLQLRGASGLATAKLGDSSKAAVGEAVLAVGNAGGAGGTPATAAGAITALGQSITASDQLAGVSEQLSGLIEVDANVQAGDSGGPLVDASGAVIGIDTAAAAGFTFQSPGGQGYAIPISAAMSVAGQIVAGHASATVHIGSTAFLGVMIGRDQGYRGGGTSGAAVTGVVAGGTAGQAGLAAGDVITSIDGTTVDSPATLSSLLAGHHPGDRIQLGWVDTAGQPHTASVQLASGPPA